MHELARLVGLGLRAVCLSLADLTGGSAARLVASRLRFPVQKKLCRFRNYAVSLSWVKTNQFNSQLTRRLNTMEFGLFMQGYLPGPQAHDPAAEHNAFMQEIELAKLADKNNWKYVWLTEHHALPEYSHLSCNEAFAGYLGAVTDRIHVGSGIFNLSPSGEPSGQVGREGHHAGPPAERPL